MTGKKVSPNFTIPSLFSRITMSHILVILLIMSSFTLGSLWTRVKQIENGTALGTTTANAQTGTPEEPAAPAEDLSPREVSVDDDAFLGDPNAPVTIIEFSDYECPFCKSFFQQAMVDIKREYVDTGKVKIVYRDMPLSFHDPLATTQAIAAECAREQGDDTTYFKYHDAIFTKTTSNGNGLVKEDLYAMAAELGLNANTFKSCLDTEKYKDEVAKDVSDAAAVGASATPSFYIGKSTENGVITGTPLIGAYPFTNFKTIIDEMLK
jgi:protein-disulfide isomerase